MTDKPTSDVAGFWAWFEAEADNLAEVVRGQRQGEITAMMDQAFLRFGLPVTYEISGSAEGPELVLTAEGDVEWASFLKTMVADAPATCWTIYGLRPRRPLEEAIRIVRVVHGVDLGEARFQARVVDGRFHLRFLDDVLFRMDDRRRSAVAALFLDYALGEEVATRTVGGLDFQPSGDGIAMGLMVNELIRNAN